MGWKEFLLNEIGDDLGLFGAGSHYVVEPLVVGDRIFNLVWHLKGTNIVRCKMDVGTIAVDGRVDVCLLGSAIRLKA